MTRPKIKKILIYGVLAVAIIGAAIYIFLIQREKAQFNQAEKEIDALYAQIVEKVGKPDQEKKEKSCGYASRVYGKGPRSCSVSTYMLFENKSNLDSNAMMAIIAESIKITPSDNLAREEVTSFTPYDQHRFNQTFGDDLQSSSKKNCSISFSYPVMPYLSAPIKPTQKENLLISLGCGGPAIAEHYPLRN